MLYAPMSQIKSFTANIKSIDGIEAIAMERAHHPPLRVDESIGQDTTGMRAFISKGEIAVSVASHAYLAALYFRDSNIIAAKVELIRMFGQFYHKRLFSYQRNSDLYG